MKCFDFAAKDKNPKLLNTPYFIYAFLELLLMKKYVDILDRFG